HRCVTIHGTNGVLVEDVVAYRTYGHCFFLEDGDETGNELYRNLALVVMKPPADDAVLPSDHSHLGPAGFWVPNPANDLVGHGAGARLSRNLALVAMKPPAGDAVLPPGLSRLGPAGFWVTNPAHALAGSVAAGSKGSGFWYALPEHPPGLASHKTDVWPRLTP